MRSAVSYMFVMAMLVSGCSPTKVGTNIPDYTISNNQIYVMGMAEVSTPSKSGKASYAISCDLNYADTSKTNSDFNSAIVTVNGVALVQVYRDGFFQNVHTMQFAQGDSLQFVIKHQKIGTVKEVVYVPQSVTDVSVSPGLSIAYEPNSDTLFNLSWSPVAANYYLVEALGYNFWQTAIVATAWNVTASDSATIVLKDNSGAVCPYVYFEVQSINTVQLGEFAPGSGFQVSGSYYEGCTNMPSTVAIPAVKGKILN